MLDILNSKLKDVLAQNIKFKEISSSNNLNMLILSNKSLNPIHEYIEYFSRNFSVSTNCVYGKYDNFADGINLTSKELDCIVIWFDWIELINKLFVSNHEEKIIQQAIEYIEFKLGEIELGISDVGIDKNIIFISQLGFPLTNNVDSILKIYPSTDKIFQIITNWIHKNEKFKITSLNIFDYIDFQKNGKLLEKKNRQFSNSNYTLKEIKNLAFGICCKIFERCGTPKKILFLDCDNTLWGGIAGEVGSNGIDIGDKNNPSLYFYQFQMDLLKLKNAGVLLTLVTKNSFEILQETFNSNRQMPLSISDFVAIKSNWKPKSENIREILRDLNLHETAGVFIDDSEFELSEVQSNFPNLLCLHKNYSSEHISNMDGKLISDFFKSKQFTTIDSKRNQMYIDENSRKESKNKFKSYQDFLNSLGMNIKIKRIKNQNQIARASQLSFRTNQFNLTQSRLSEEKIQLLMLNSNYLLYLVSVQDKFGDMGDVVFLQIGLQDSATAVIEEFVMSCRVFERKIEQNVMFHLLNILRIKKCDSVVGLYKPTERNVNFADFYSKIGFKDLPNFESYKRYSFSLSKNSIKPEFEIETEIE